MQWWYQKFVLPLQRMNPSVWASFTSGRLHLNSIYNPACGIQIVGNDVAPTFLKEGRGEVVVIVVGVVFHLGWGLGTRSRSKFKPVTTHNAYHNCAKCGKADCHLGKGRGIGISLAPKRKAVTQIWID